MTLTKPRELQLLKLIKPTYKPSHYRKIIKSLPFEVNYFVPVICYGVEKKKLPLNFDAAEP